MTSPYAIQSAISVSLNYNPSTGSGDWHLLTDHNRQEVKVTPEVIESQARMANGTLRKYIVAKKNKISTSWNFIPSNPSLTVDTNKSSAWLDAFYKANIGVPVYVKVISSEIESVTNGIPSDAGFKSSSTSAGGAQIYKTFISDFNSTVIKRTATSDYVDMSIEFTEI